jgi:prepilin-type N-terminal cleavage/methylation domain-containing protein
MNAAEPRLRVFLHGHAALAGDTNANVMPRSSAGFTLLEVLLSLAIIALLGAVLIGGSARLLNDQPVSADDVFWSAVQEARKTALKSGHEVRLKFNRETKRFVIVDGLAPSVLAADGFTRLDVPLKEFPIALATPDLEIDFLTPTKGGNMILVRGVLLESQPAKFVTFYADGTCSPFRLQIFRSGAAHTLAIDPWTCAPVLEAKATP